MIKKFINHFILHRDKFLFVFVNIFVSFMGFVRSFLFLHYYDFKMLGIITLFYTIIMFLSVFQFGLLHGGYRIVSLGELKKDLNNLLFTYFFLLLLLSLLILFIYHWSSNQHIGDLLWIFIAIIAGVLNLAKNWISNVFIALSQLKALNTNNILTIIISFFPLFLIKTIGIWAGIFSIFINPLFFIIFAFIKNPAIIPSNFNFSIHKVKYVLSFGFIPFLSSVFDQLNVQVEKWGITFFLGIEQLGKFYLPTLFTTLFLLIPVSINNLLFPQAIKNYSEGNFRRTKNIIDKYYIIIVCYCVFVSIMVKLIFSPIVNMVFPNHVFAIKYVYLILPGLFALQLLAPIGLLFNASVILKPMFYAYLISLIFNAIFVLILGSLGHYNLTIVSILKSMVGFIVLIGYIFGYFINKKKIWSLHNLSRINLP